MRASQFICFLIAILISVPASAETRWSKVGFSGGNISDLVSFPENPEIMLACVEDHGLYRSTDRGESWSQILDGSWRDISLSEEGIAFSAGETGVMVSRDTGISWKPCLDTSAWKVVAYRDGIVAVDPNNEESYSTKIPWQLSRDNGTTWESWAGTERTISLLFHESGTVYRWAEFSLFRSDPGVWNDWKLIYTPGYRDNPEIRFGYAKGDSVLYGYSRYVDHHPMGYQAGGVFRSMDAGASWQFYADIYDVSTIEPSWNILLTGTPDGTLYSVSLDSATVNPIGFLGGEITAIDAKRYEVGELVVATKGGIFKTTDSGRHWRKSDTGILHPEISSVQAIPVGASGERILVSTKESGVFYSDDGGAQWTWTDPAVRTIPGLLKTSNALPRRIYAGESSLYTSRDDGETWQRIEQVPFTYYGWYGRTIDIDIDPLNSNRIAITYFSHSLDNYLGNYYLEGQYMEAAEGSDGENPGEWKWKRPIDSSELYKTRFSEDGSLVWFSSKSWQMYSKPCLTAMDNSGEVVRTINLPGNSGLYYWRIDGQSCYVFGEQEKRLWITPDLGETWNSVDLALKDYTTMHSIYPHSEGHFGDLALSPDKKAFFLLFPGNGILISADRGKTWADFSRGMDTAVVYQLAFSPVNPARVFAATNDGLYCLDGATGTGQTNESYLVPEGFTLSQNAPNPFNPSTVIGLELAEEMDARLTVYSVAGQKVRELASGLMAPGRHTFSWDGRDDSGAPVSSGVYFYRLTAGGKSAVKRMLLLR